MNMLLKEWDGKMQRHEHSIHNLFHNEAFWAAAIISFILISMVLLAIFAPNTGPHTNFPTPFGPYPYYNW
ncbi:MAG: hypothetical protein LLF92_05935 [Planctomycetaceae bacterium]|jgi:hypothetical protein|nr:hypothetical protein [Planctomycetaceae bacterium]